MLGFVLRTWVFQDEDSGIVAVRIRDMTSGFSDHFGPDGSAGTSCVSHLFSSSSFSKHFQPAAYEAAIIISEYL